MALNKAVCEEVFEPELSLVLCNELLDGIIIDQLLTLEAWTTDDLTVCISDDLGG